MRQRNVLLIGSLAALGLVIALGVLFFRANPSPSAASPYNVLWTLTSLHVNGQTYELVPKAPVTLTLHETSHTITGSSGCNSYQATYQQHNAQVRFQDFLSTAIGCPSQAVRAQENLYLQTLSHAETLLVSANAMTIIGAGGKDILRFSTVPKSTSFAKPSSSLSYLADLRTMGRYQDYKNEHCFQQMLRNT